MNERSETSRLSVKVFGMKRLDAKDQAMLRAQRRLLVLTFLRAALGLWLAGETGKVHHLYKTAVVRGVGRMASVAASN